MSTERINEETEKKLFRLLIFGLFVYMLSMAFMPTTNDFCHLYNSGKWIVEHKAVPYENYEFVLSGYGTVVQQWLYDVVLYYAAGFGFIGMAVLTFVQEVFLLFSYYKLGLELGCSKFKATAAAVIPFLVFFEYLNVRPQMITVILLVWSIIFIERYRKTGNTKLLYILPLLTMIEANIHSTCVLFHIAIILPYIVPFLKECNIKINRKAFIIPVLLDIMAMFINPYTYKAVICVFSIYDDIKSFIGELQSLSVLDFAMIWVVVNIICLYILFKKKVLTNIELYLSSGMIYCFVNASRNSMFLTISLYYCIARVLSASDCSFMNKLKLNKFVLTIAYSCIGMTFISVSYGCAFDFLMHNDDITYSLPGYVTASKQAIDYIKEHESDTGNIKVFTDFDIGSYFIYNDIPKVYMQSKAEPFSKNINGKEDLFSEYMSVMMTADTEEIESFFNKYDFDYICVQYNDRSLLLYLKTSDDYESIIDENCCHLFKKKMIKEKDD